MGKKIIRIILALLTSAVIVVLVIFLAVKITPEPPYQEIKTAIQSISAASAKQASVYSRKLYSEAENALDSAMAVWKRENKKFIFMRNYEKVLEYARLADKKAREAASLSVQNSNDLEHRLGLKIKSLEETKSKIDEFFGKYPLESETRTRLSKGKLMLKEAEIAYEKKQLLQANKKLNDAEYLLNSVYENTLSDIKTWFASLSTWKKWVDNAIAESGKRKSYLIVIDKFAHKFYLYFAGKLKYEFDAELGKNWTGDKRIKGDKATPEGRYKIIKKLQGRATRWYKSLALDYPNSEDVERFMKEKASGTISSAANIGGGIEIHGGGGKNTDWTDGCIALTNKNMDIIYPIVQIGTPVVIVGSLRSLDEIMNEN